MQNAQVSTVIIINSSVSPSDEKEIKKNVFLRTIPQKTTIYEGEVLPVNQTI